jgi:hypothetical protein
MEDPIIVTGQAYVGYGPLGYGIYYPMEEVPGPPPTLPPPQAADIARQMTEGVVGIGVATMALGMVSQIIAGAITGPGVAAAAKELVAR